MAEATKEQPKQQPINPVDRVSVWSLSRTPQIGDLVQWFDNADRSVGAVAGIVSRIELGNGQVSLTLFPHNGNILFKEGVRHIDDPSLTTRPGLRGKSGAWEYLKKK